MDHPLDILAEGFEDWIQIVVILAFLVLGLLFRLTKKAAEDKQARQQKERWDEISREQEAGQRPQPPQAPAGAARTPRQARQPQPAVLKPVTASAAPPRRATGDRTRGSVEAAAAQTRRSLAPAPARAKAEEDPYALAAGPEAIDLRLASGEQARRAILLHEILSAPKALRQGSEMWDV